MTDATDRTELAERGDAGAGFDAATFRDLARRRLFDAPPRGHDDPRSPLVPGAHLLNGNEEPEDGSSRLAAVLVPVVDRSGEATVLLTQRTDHLPSHPGQIAFPGGKLEPFDDGPLDAALREAHEEIGLPRQSVQILGYLDIYPTRTGFRIVPVVGIVAPDVVYRLDPEEVAAVFEVPLSFLMCPDNHQRSSRDWAGTTRHFYEMPFGERYIWGVTAGIIRNLYDRVYG